MAQSKTSRPSRRIPLQCPRCSSYSAVVVDIRPPYARCRCADCGTIYNYRMGEITNGDDNGSAYEDREEEDFTPKRRKTKADYRAEITPAPAPTPKELGFNTTIIEDTIAAGPAGLRQAQRIALKFAKQFQQEAIDHWRKETDWLKNSDGSTRACARYAMVWRPRFLAALSMCHSVELACRHVKLCPDTAYYHRAHDPQFAEQWDQAREYGIEMLHARVFQRALEGDCEPIVYMGVVVGWVKKYDSKLQIEMLRAYMPDRFKTPGGASVSIATRGDILVLTEAQRARIMEKRRQALLAMPTTRAGEDARRAALAGESQTHTV